MNRRHLNHIRIGVWGHYQPLICWWGLIIYGLILMMLKIVRIVRLLLCLRICWRSLLVLVIWKYKCLAICMEAVWRGWLGKSSVLLLCRKLAIGIVSPYLRKCHNHSSWKAYSQLDGSIRAPKTRTSYQFPMQQSMQNSSAKTQAGH